MAAVVLAKAAGSSIGRTAWSQLPKVSGCVIVQQRDASNVPTKYQLSALKKGTGGRSSFSGIVATVFGANGFLGRYVCNQLGKIGSQIIVPYRADPYEVKRLRLVGDLGQVLFIPFHLEDEESIRKAVSHSNVVINLVGQDAPSRNFSLDAVNNQGARRLARISKEMGVERFIHVSHLNAVPEPQTIWKTSEYLKTKYAGECAVREEFPDAIIFKPSDIFGEDDRFINIYRYWGRWSLVPFPNTGIALWEKGERTIKQPVFVSNVAAGIMQAIRNSGMEGKTIEAVGPSRYYLADLVDYFIKVMRREEYLQIKGSTLSLRLKNIIGQHLKVFQPFFNQYNPDKLEREFISDWTTAGNPTLEDLGVDLTKIDEVAYYHLYNYRQSAHYYEKFGEFAKPKYPQTVEAYEAAPATR